MDLLASKNAKPLAKGPEAPSPPELNDSQPKKPFVERFGFNDYSDVYTAASKSRKSSLATKRQAGVIMLRLNIFLLRRGGGRTPLLWGRLAGAITFHPGISKQFST